MNPHADLRFPHRRGAEPEAAWLRLGLQGAPALDARALSHWLKLAATFQRISGHPLRRPEARFHSRNLSSPAVAPKPEFH